MFYREKTMLHDKNYNFYCENVFENKRSVLPHNKRCCILFANDYSNAGGIASKMKMRNFFTDNI